MKNVLQKLYRFIKSGGQQIQRLIKFDKMKFPAFTDSSLNASEIHGSRKTLALEPFCSE